MTAVEAYVGMGAFTGLIDAFLQTTGDVIVDASICAPEQPGNPVLIIIEVRATRFAFSVQGIGVLAGLLKEQDDVVTAMDARIARRLRQLGQALAKIHDRALIMPAPRGLH